MTAPPDFSGRPAEEVEEIMPRGNEKDKQLVPSTAEGSSPFVLWLTTYRRVLEGLGKETNSSALGPPEASKSAAASSQAVAKKATHEQHERIESV